MQRVDESVALSPTRSPAESDSFARFYFGYHSKLRHYVFNQLGDHAAAEDVIGDTMMLIWQRWDDLDGVRDEVKGFPRIRSYAYSTAKNKVKEYFRKVKGFYSLAGIDPDSEIFISPASASSGAELSETYEVIHALPDRQRKTLLMKMAGFNDREVAEELGVRESTVRKHLELARRKVVAFMDSCIGANT